MCTKVTRLLVLCISLSLMAGAARAADPIGWWYLEDGAGATAADSSGNGLTGTITDAVWVSPGSFDRGSALEFNDGGYVDLGNSPMLDFGTTDWSVTAWYKTGMTGTGDANKGTIYAKGGDTGGGIRYCLILSETTEGVMTLVCDDDTTKYVVNATSVTNDDQWHFVVGMREGTELRLYIDGELEGTGTVTATYSLAGTSQHNAYIGAITDHGAGLYKTYIGLIDDVRVFGQALTDTEVQEVMTGYGPTALTATNLKPAPGTTDVVRDGLVLGWDASNKARKHNVYFGESFDDVDTADLGSSLLISENQDANSLALGRLDFGTTYFWRVDEVNGAPDYGVNKGDTADFTVEPVAIPVAALAVTASSSSDDMGPENTVNGSGLDADGSHSTEGTDMWVSSKDQAPEEPVFIEYEFDQAYQLNEVKIWNSNQAMESVLGFGIQDMIVTYSTDGSAWTRLGGEEGLVQLAQSPGNADYTGQWVSLDILAKYVKFTAVSNWSAFFQQYGLSEVQFYAIPTAARTPNPASGTQGVDPRSDVLSWRAGRDAGQHEVFVSSDPEAMGAAHTVSVNRVALDAMNLSLDTTYYWQVNEVNEAQVPSQWAGDTWSFTTLGSFVVDDFESYNNLSPDRPFQSWVDGYGFTTPAPGNPGNNTGSGVGHDIWNTAAPTLMETASTIPGSSQSLPVYYNNSGANGKLAYSQVDHAVGGQDWTVNGLQTLSIAFRGQAGNTGTLYAKINSTKISYDLDAADIAVSSWQVWNIDLTSISGLNNVTTLSLGIDGAGASGMILIDDIRLYAKPGELITPAEPDAVGLLTRLAFDEGAGAVARDSSGNGHDVTLVNSPVWTSGKAGSALQFGGGSHGLDDDAEDYLNGLEALTIGLWVKSGVIDTDQGILIASDPAGNDNTVTMRYDAAGASFGGANVVKTAVSTADAEQQLESSSNLQTTEWQHLCMTWETGGLLRLYVNGVEDVPTGRSNTNNTGPVSTCDKLIIGKGGKDNTNTTGWDGLIDEVVIYGRALSAEEILWLAGKTSPIHKSF